MSLIIMIHANPRAQDATRVPLRLSDLERRVDREPRIPDLLLGERLGFAKPHNVRKLIDRNRAELQLHGALVERPSSFLRRGENLGAARGAQKDGAAGVARNPGGRPGTMWFLNEPQCLVICALARTPIAVQVRQDIIAVYMASRRAEDWVPPSEKERRCLRLIAETADVEVLPERQWTDAGGDEYHAFDRVLVVPATDDLLDTLAAFDEHDGREGESNGLVVFDPDLDQDAGEQREHDADMEEGDGDVDLETTALERAGAGFDRSGPDDNEDSHDAESVNEDGLEPGSHLDHVDHGVADLDAAAEAYFGADDEGEIAGGDLLTADQASFAAGNWPRWGIA